MFIGVPSLALKSNVGSFASWVKVPINPLVASQCNVAPALVTSSGDQTELTDVVVKVNELGG